MTWRATIVAISVVAAAQLAGCSQRLKLMEDDSKVVLRHQTITAPNPADRGSYAVKYLTYGSGTDKRRSEYREGVAIKTKTVDASPFATIQKPQAKARPRPHLWGQPYIVRFTATFRRRSRRPSRCQDSARRRESLRR